MSRRFNIGDWVTTKIPEGMEGGRYPYLVVEVLEHECPGGTQFTYTCRVCIPAVPSRLRRLLSKKDELYNACGRDLIKFNEVELEPWDVSMAVEPDRLPKEETA